MILDQLLKMRCYTIPPETEDLAVERVQEFGRDCLYGLIDMPFLNIKQLSRALTEIGFHLHKQKDLNNVSCGPIVSSLYLAVGRDETTYNLLITEGSVTKITNAKIDNFGDSVSQEDIKAFEDFIENYKR